MTSILGNLLILFAALLVMMINWGEFKKARISGDKAREKKLLLSYCFLTIAVIIEAVLIAS